ncbi:MAE_28990/MAE_18760 family HEPN-like nuclease [Sphingomonas sp. VDB2]|uniref:MAE_28990/MAE_18760 family HEPN-like nuclease n=1 Tax=Sphingomonas sp. VDB2 TaxID=3228751 RepID=UPI003A8080ED
MARLDEVSLLRSKAATLARTKYAMRHGAEISALCRASVVLLSSHIEAYIKELGEHTLDAIFDNKVCRSKIAPLFFYHISKERIENIRSGSDPEKISGNMRIFVETDSLMWKSTGEFPAQISATDFNKGFSNPKFEKAKSYFSRFGYVNYRRDFLIALGRNGQSTINNIDQIVDTRNSIAHGDPNATKTPAEISDMIQTARTFCRTTDSIFAKWCSGNLCNIR